MYRELDILENIDFSYLFIISKVNMDHGTT